MNDEQSENIPLDLVGHRIFGDYEITKKIGEGGMGAVFLAQHRVIDQKIAIKVLHKELASSEETVERFNREAHVISLLSHPNIIRVFIFGHTPDDLMYLAMEFVNGISLAEYYNTIGFPDELTAIKITKQICSAVAEAHDLSIVHRDLKPENILLTSFRGEDKYVKILDFGIAKITEGKDQKRLTQAGIVYGTPDYLAPEQAMAEDLDGRCDIYSIGVILFEIMTGQLPFIRSTIVETLQAHAFEPAPDPIGYTDRIVSKSMRDIIMKCLEKDRTKRFQDAMELYTALEQRELEILANTSKLSARRQHVPGSEMTSMFSGVLMEDRASYHKLAPYSKQSTPNYQDDEQATLDQKKNSATETLSEHAAAPATETKKTRTLVVNQTKNPPKIAAEKPAITAEKPADETTEQPIIRQSQPHLNTDIASNYQSGFPPLAIAVLIVLAIILIIAVIILIVLIQSK